MQDPESFLNELGVALTCAVDPARPARIDEAHRSQVNWEVYFFANEAARAEFDANPLLYCGLLTDPVSKARFAADENAPSSTYQGRVYFFQSVKNRERFVAMPDSYANPAHKMIPKEASGS